MSTLEISEDLCRLCLLSETNMVSIYEPDNDLLNKIYELASIEVLPIQGTPLYICEYCKSKLIISVQFKKQCIMSNNKLMEFIENACEKEPRLIEIIESEIEERIVNNPDDLHKFVNNTHVVTTKNFEINLVHKDLNTEFIEPVAPKLKGGKKLCIICGTMHQHLKQHMVIHAPQKPHKCPYCSKEFAQKGNFKHHLNIHTGNKPFKCKLCEKRFAEPNSVRSHMVTHTGERKYSCEICGKTFGLSHVLSTHRRIHTQDRRHECSYCLKKFLSGHALKKHIRTHTGEKPYKCDKCDKQFTSSGNLTTHFRVHTKEKPYKCHVCESSFAYRSVLKSHIKIHA